MVNIIINDYNNDGDGCGCSNDDIITILNDNIKTDVNLIEQIEKLAKSNSLLVQHVSKLEKENETLLELIKQSNQKIDETLLEMNLLKDYITTELTEKINCNKKTNTVNFKKTTQHKEKETKTTPSPKNKKMKRGKAVKDTDEFIPNKSLAKEWKDLKMHEDGTIWNHSSRKEYKLPIDLNILLYIRECDKQHMNRATMKFLMSKYDIKYGTFGKIVYNIRNGNFNNIIRDYYAKIKKAKFSIKNNKICVNKTNTNIPLQTAKEWIHIIVNSEYKQKSIIGLQKENSEFDKDIVRIICDSYNNSELLKLLKNVNKNTFVENNSSKRKNIISNGGLI